MHDVMDLKKGKKYFREVIQKKGLFCQEVSNPMYSGDCEGCGKFIWIGQCSSRCLRAGAHVQPEGQRKEALVTFQNECQERYNKDKKGSDPDFQ